MRFLCSPFLFKISRALLAALIYASSPFLAITAAHAAGLEVSPIGLSLGKTENAGTFTFTNVLATPIHAQARIFKWTQDEQGAEVLTPTKDILVSPPILAIAANASQDVRLIRQPDVHTSTEEEQHYRLIVDEIPDAIAPTAKQQIRLVLRYSVPIFLNAEESPIPSLQWRAEGVGDKKTLLRISNTGKTRAQLAQTWLEVHDKNGNKVVTDLVYGLWGYVLPGKTIYRTVNIGYPQLVQNGATLISTINSKETPIHFEK